MADAAAAPSAGFQLSLDGFEGPFDLLLRLITGRELDVTEVSLSSVTDEFIAYLKTLEGAGRLDEASEFLVVAATLLDLKAARLLPQGEVVDAEGIAVLEARDLLFARLLQYRAFKQASAWFAERLDAEAVRHARQVPLEERFRTRIPELVWSTGLAEFVAIAVVALTPKEVPVLGTSHLHAPQVSIREQAALVVARLKASGARTFRELIDGADGRPVVVARFLAVLELYRHGAVAFDQLEPLGDLTIRWLGRDWSADALATLGVDYEG